MPTNSHEWFADESYWEENRSFIWPNQRISNSGIGAGYAMQLLGACNGESILDLACGFGRHSFEFYRKGLVVTGVDLNPKFIDEANSKVIKTKAEIRFIRADMREFVEPESYNHIVMMYNSFGYFKDPADDMLVISNCFKSLLPGGKLLISAMGREINRRHMPSGESRHWWEKDGKYRLQECLFNEESSILSIKWILLNGSISSTFDYNVRLYSKQKLLDLLTKVGFDDIQFYGSIKGTQYDDKAHSLVVTAQKSR
jgi:SAM-dependent methyltransferase